jgi:hypothetical protein
VADCDSTQRRTGHILPNSLRFLFRFVASHRIARIVVSTCALLAVPTYGEAADTSDISLLTCSQLNMDTIHQAAISPTGEAGPILDVFPNFSPATQQDLQIRGHGRGVLLLFQFPMNLNFLWALSMQKKDKSVPITSKYGLERFVKTFGVENDIYFAHQGKLVTDFIECNIDGSVPFPGCTQWINHGKFMVQTSYGKQYLSQWKNIKFTVGDMVDRCGR